MLSAQIADLKRSQDALRERLLDRLSDEGAPAYIVASNTQCVRKVTVRSTRLVLRLLTKHKVPVDTIAAIQAEATKEAASLQVTSIATARKRKHEEGDVVELNDGE